MDKCPCGNKARRRGLCDTCRGLKQPKRIAVPDALAADIQLARLKTERDDLRGKNKLLMQQIMQLQDNLGVMQHMRASTAPFVIKPQHGHGTSEATAVLAASDWHMEQAVTAGETNGLNVHNLEVSSRRANRFFTAGLRLIKLLNQDVHIYNVVLALLGDFMTGQIHGAANAEKNLLPPAQALVYAQNHIHSGINFLLNNSDYKLIIPCKVGNHSRTTEKSRIGFENGHSYEYLMYLHLQELFRGEPRVQFIIEEAFSSYVDIYDETFRFNHGHTIKFQGGVGGLFIPAYKKIDKWDKQRKATRTVIGHHHQYLDGGNFHCNGSSIGFDGRAAGEGYNYEPPMQTLLLVDKKRGQTCKWPVLVEK